MGTVDSRKESPAERSVGRELKRAEQAMLRAKSTALKPTGLSLAQFVALDELDREPGVTAASLARACFVSPQAMMVVLKALEEQGLVKRQPHPRHGSVLELFITEPGQEALNAGRERIEPVERRIVGAFSTKELEMLGALLQRWSEAARAE